MAVKLGRFFFRHRHLLYVPFVLVIFLVDEYRYTNLIVTWSVGIGVLLFGGVLRLWAVRCCGKRTIYKREEGKWLTMSGPYSYVRNPLYHSNILIGCGMITISQLIWLIPIFVVVGFLFYHFVVLYEESRLSVQFGADYQEFKERVPRWIPRLSSYRAAGETRSNPWSEVYLAERLRFLAVLIVILLITAKEYFSK